VPREKTKDVLECEEEEYQEFLRREVGDDLKGLIEVDRDQTGVLEDVQDHPKDPSDKKLKKEKPKHTKNKDRDDQEFLMK
jgi:protein KRI1